MSPEMLQAESRYGRPADFWAIGVTSYQLLTGFYPFFLNDGLERSDAFLENIRIAEPDYCFYDEKLGWQELSDSSKDFVSRLLTKEPELRLGSGPDGVKNIKRASFFSGMNWDALAAKQIPPPFLPDANARPLHLDQEISPSLRFIAYACKETAV